MAPIRFNSLGVYLNCTNVEKSAAFYEGLGFKRAGFMPEWNVYTYNLGGSNLVLGPHDMPGDPKAADWLKHKPWGVGSIIMPNVTNVDEIHKRARSMGAEIEMPPTDMEWGSRVFSVVDPDGYSLMFEQDAAPAKRAAKAAKKAKGAKRGAKKTAKSARKKAGATRKKAPARRRK